MTNPHHAYVRVSLFFPAPLDAMMAMDGSSGNIDMYVIPLPVSSLNDRNRVWKKAREAKIELDSIPSAATTTGMHSFLLYCAEQIIDTDRLMCRQYELTIRQEPKQAHICGIDGKAALAARGVPQEAEFVRTVSLAPDAGFFVFPDLYVRTEGSYRLKLCLFEVVGAPFYVSTAKKFPGVEDKCLFAAP
ncbi:hypothetical protein K438DRAFT_1801785, partial [Mycena galopus ATCC 62051]